MQTNLLWRHYNSVVSNTTNSNFTNSKWRGSYLIIGATGPNVSSWAQIMSVLTCVIIVGSKKLPPSWCRAPPATTLPPLDTASFTCCSTYNQIHANTVNKSLEFTIERVNKELHHLLYEQFHWYYGIMETKLCIAKSKLKFLVKCWNAEQMFNLAQK